jgi:hypothetical protein
MSEVTLAWMRKNPLATIGYIVELEAEREQASQDYADMLKDYRTLRKDSQALVDGLFLAVKGDYHYSQQDTDLMDALKAALEQ